MNAVAVGADVGRSTLYNHFRRKEEVLSASMGPHLDVLADTVRRGGTLPLFNLMQHFWERRRHRAVFSPGPCRNILATDLATRIEGRLEGAGWRIPKPLAARLIADHQLNLIHHWLSHHTALTPTEAVTMLERSSCAIRDAVREAVQSSTNLTAESGS